MLDFIHFLHPEFLYGLFLLAIPIILHFFSFKKYKKIYFSNFNFLQALQQQKKNSSRLKNILLLVLRLLILSFIIIAFAYPYTTPRNTQTTDKEKTQVVIYLDNSFSMSNTGSHGTLLEEAKKHLFDILNTYPTGTSFFLLTNDNQNLPSLSKDEIINTLSGLKISPQSKYLSEIFRTTQELAKDKKTTLFLLSDFQSTNCDFQHIAQDSLITPIFLILHPENTNNLYIKDVQFEHLFHQKNQNEKLTITLANSSAQNFNNIPVTLTINGKKKNIHKANIPAQGETTVEINYLNNAEDFCQGVIEITDLPIVFDNKFFFSYNLKDKINILCIEQNEHLPYFEKLFADSNAFHIQYLNVNQASNLRLNNYNLIILDRIEQLTSGLSSALETYLNKGGNLFIIPGEQLSVNILNNLLQKIHAPQFLHSDTNTVIEKIEVQADLFKEVFEKLEQNTTLPYIKQFYHISPTDKAEQLLSDKKGNILLAIQNSGHGKLYISTFSFAPDNSDMVYHPLFVPIMVNMSYNLNSNLNTSWFLNSNKQLYLQPYQSDNDNHIFVRNENNTVEFIPEIRKDFSGNLIMVNTKELKEAGLYNVIRDNHTIDIIACNYDRSESQMQFCHSEEIQKHFPEARTEEIKTTQFDHNSELIKEIVLQDNNHYFASWFILLALLTLLAEQWIWKRKLM
ncbi:BatA domain-containing protein [Odoribacter lunatus]|uniref:BatA domain-containing protein n=1 Tax=Odoribacter lunatus TaxID=2941335 RepID=UPI002408656E|nr:BatA domain-containing protein [Odoribacter lunatus]